MSPPPVSVTAPAQAPGRPAVRRRVGIGLLVGSAVLVLAYPIGSHIADTGRLVLLLRLFGAPFTYAGVTAALATAASWLLLRPGALRAVAVSCGAMLLLSVVAAGQLLAVDWEVTRTVSAPEADREVVVRSGSAVIDPLWEVTVVEGRGLGAREWHLARFDGDDPGHELRRVSWSGPDRLRLTTADGSRFTLTLDPATGRPRSTLSVP